MSGKITVSLFVLVALGGLTVWQLQSRQTEDRSGPTVSVKLPKVDKAAVDEISISSTENGTIRLKKTDGVWRITVPMEAMAAQAAAETALDKLAELEVTGVAATKDTNHARLEVDQDKGVHVVANGGGQPIIDVIIGKYQTGNTMLRKQGEVPVATVKGSLRYAFDKELKDWRDREITKLDAETITALSFTNPKGSFSFVKGEGWVQAEGQAPIEKFDAGKVQSAVATLVALRAADFAADGATAETTGLGEGAATVEVTRKEGEAESQLTIRVGKKEDKNYYLTVSDDPIVYMVSSFVGDRLTPNAEAFQLAEQKPDELGRVEPTQVPPGVQLPPGFKMPAGAQIRTRESMEADAKKAAAAAAAHQ